jgi:hypothetical protein
LGRWIIGSRSEEEKNYGLAILLINKNYNKLQILQITTEEIIDELANK